MFSSTQVDDLCGCLKRLLGNILGKHCLKVVVFFDMGRVNIYTNFAYFINRREGSMAIGRPTPVLAGMLLMLPNTNIVFPSVGR